MSNHTVEKLVYTRVINSYTILICLYLFIFVLSSYRPSKRIIISPQTGFTYNELNSKKMKTYNLYLIAFVLLLIGNGLLAQAPEGVNYQAVARDMNGEPLSNELIDVRFVITDANENDIYQETHPNTNTNEFGLFTLVIGNGNVDLGDFETIAWGASEHFLSVVIDSGDGFELISTAQLMSVPYALFAKEAANGPTGPQGPAGEDGVSIEWLGTFSTPPANPELNQAYYNENDGIAYIWDGNAWQIIAQDGQDGDALETATTIVDNGDGTYSYFNEDNDEFIISTAIQSVILNGQLLEITDGGGTQQVDLSTINTDEQTLTFDQNTGALGITNGNSVDLSGLEGETYSAGDGIDISNGVITNTGDLDPQNELQDVTLTGNDLSLTQSNIIVDLSPYLDNTDEQTLTFEETTGDLSISGGNVVNLSGITSDSWSLNGNNTTTGILGTTNNYPLIFHTNGTERARIDENGNLGLGTNSPGTNLHIADNEGPLILVQELNPNNGASLILESERQYHLISNETGMFRIQDLTAGQSRFNINPVGNVGIGTEPNAQLHVNATSGISHFRITTQQSANGGASLSLSYDNDQTFYIWNHEGGDMRFVSGGQTHMFMNGASGNIGIGTTLPSARLHVEGDFRLNDGTAQEGYVLSATDANGNAEWSDINLLLDDPLWEANGDNIITTNIGGVGIGATIPTGKLHISLDNDNDGPVTIDKANGTGQGPLMEWYGFSDTHRIQLDYDGNYVFNTDNTLRDIEFAPGENKVMTIKANNTRVGIGTTAPQEALDVSGNVTADNHLYNQPKERYLTLGQTDFRQARTSTADLTSIFGNGGVGIINATSLNALVAPVHLPHGARVTNVEIWYVDDYASGDMTIHLDRRTFNGFNTSLGSVQTSGESTATQTLSFNPGTTINNESYTYNIRAYSASWPSGTSPDMRIYTVKITYEITETD